MKPEMKKLIIANLPYLLFVYLFGKLGQTYRLAAGADLSEKLLHLADGFLFLVKSVFRVSSLIFFGFRHEECRPVVCFTGCPSCRT